jgi:hypothetical protein
VNTLFLNSKAFLHNITPSFIKYNNFCFEHFESEGNETYKLHGYFLYGNVFGLCESFQGID